MMWYQDHEIIDELIKLSEDLDKEFLDEVIVSVGHSPSWVAYVIEQIRLFKGQLPKVIFVPFSGKFHYRSDPRTQANFPANTIAYTKSINTAEKENLASYFTYLSGLLTPYKEKKVIMDFFGKGEGITSFMDILLNHTPNIDPADYQTLLLSVHSRQNGLVTSTSDAGVFTFGTNFYKEPCNRLFDSIAGRQGAHQQERDNSEKHYARFVSYYDPTIQTQPIDVLVENEKQVKLAQHVIKKALERKFA